MSLDDDIGVYLARMGPDTVKAPTGETTVVHHQPQQQQQQQQQPENNSTLPAASNMQHDMSCLGMAPPLPERNALRRSRFLDALVMQAAVPSETAEAASVAMAPNTSRPSLPTPHDVYLSSEEDASSAGDVSEDEDVDEYSGTMEDDGSTCYGFRDQGDDDIARPDRLSSPDSVPRHGPVPEPSALPPSTEATDPVNAATTSTTTIATAVVQPRRLQNRDTARVVSVIFSGRPSLVDLALLREARRRSCIDTTTQSVLSSSASSNSATSSSCINSTSASEVTRPSTASDSLTSDHNASNCALSSYRDRRCAMENVRPTDINLGATLEATKRASQAFLLTDPFANNHHSHSHKNSANGAQSAPQKRSFSSSPPTNTDSPSASHSTPPSHSSSSTPSTPSAILRGVTRSLTLSRRRSRPMLLPEDMPVSPMPPMTPGMAKRGNTGGFLGNLAGRRRSMKVTR
ncbi:hypothetical protein CMQ_2894 [Grosmannia clavigera kw1407]|uniref:Uncharacterized protein n=1 Tax=Grosmannia clavigera (strain kw1407 / UAMH 11150) TaxID=655863 RepID=F0XG63_GROCL|nr:uncharacterized protein CMQ_2894 [Grosmannia clavigera kw1407]EFX02965.1 hypothetical protein CMQ_2894 [Grosmannia clavigera kw1407]